METRQSKNPEEFLNFPGYKIYTAQVCMGRGLRMVALAGNRGDKARR